MDKRPRKALLAPLTKVAGLFCARSLIQGCVLLLRLRIRRNTAGPQHDGNNGRYAAEVRPHRSCGRQQAENRTSPYQAAWRAPEPVAEGGYVPLKSGKSHLA